jgi:predicted ATP-grasp superfamily ATP-dependent carboligase
LNDTEVCRIYHKPELYDSTLIVCWHEDGGCLGLEVFTYLHDYLEMEMFAEIEPKEFFGMSGVLVENDVAKFPESKFFYSAQNNLVILKSAVPRYEWYKFNTSVLDIASDICKVKEIFTIGSMVSIAPHTQTRELISSFNKYESKSYLKDYSINTGMDYETPSGQRPTMSTYLIWEALRRNITGVSLWVPVPFYLISVRDWKGCRMILEFINKYRNLGISLHKLDEFIKEQNDEINSVLNNDPEIASIIQKLENGTAITESDSNKLVAVMENRLKRGDFY